MKQFLYFTIFFASIGTIVLVVSNPKLVQRGVSYFGAAPAGSQESSSNRPEDDQLAKFLSHYSGKNASSESSAISPSSSFFPTPTKSETIIIPPPPIPPVPVSPILPQLEPLPKVESSKIEPLKPEPLKSEPLKSKPPQPEPLKPESPQPQPEPLKSEPLKPEPPQPEPPKTEPFSIVSSTSPSLPIAASPIVPTKTEHPKIEHLQSTRLQPELPKVEPEKSELAETAIPSGVGNFPAVKTSEPSEESNAGFASSRHGAVPAAAIETLEKWSEPPMIPNKNESPLPFASSPSETIPTFSAGSLPPISPETGNDPFLQTLNSQPVSTSTVPDSATFDSMVHSSVSQGEAQSTISIPPTRSVYDSQPLSSPSSSSLPPSSLLPQQQQQQPLESSSVLQHTSLSVPQQKIGSQFQIDPSVMVEEVPCHGTETVARVGTQVILMCDLLPQLRRAGFQVLNENLKQVSEEERTQISEKEKENFINMFVENQYPAFLQEQIIVALVFNDYLLAKSKEEREMFDKKFGEEFDQHEVPVLIKEFGVRNNIELKQYLKDKLGSSLDRERMLWIRSKIAQQWIMFNMQEASGECTHDEMMEFYTKHKDQFTSELRVQWQELFVAFSNHPTEEAARNKIAWMGNQVVAGYPLEEIAKVNSEGFTASKGGFWDWTKIGSLTSPELEQAVFSLPVNKMSTIIKGSKGFHIIRVVKREEAETVPFIEAQVTIRERIKMERRQKLQSEYFVELKKRYPTRILRERIDFDL
ncbi:MAG: peptidylprolyl isomerase [Planctomycetaceae bacterium]|nr:peptidylprolyl isomerase [Planctomycetaceae bacterium]